LSLLEAVVAEQVQKQQHLKAVAAVALVVYAQL
jgi:hypothetical protein